MGPRLHGGGPPVCAAYENGHVTATGTASREWARGLKAIRETSGNRMMTANAAGHVHIACLTDHDSHITRSSFETPVWGSIVSSLDCQPACRRHRPAQGHAAATEPPRDYRTSRIPCMPASLCPSIAQKNTKWPV